MEKLQIRIKKLNQTAVIPKYATGGSSGFDLIANSFKAFYMFSEEVRSSCLLERDSIELPPNTRLLVGTGLVFEIPIGFEMQIRPRSGNSLKKGVHIALGTIDSDYRGEVGIILHNISGDVLTIKVGDRLAQGVILPVYRASFIEASELSDTARGEGGFGHTGH